MNDPESEELNFTREKVNIAISNLEIDIESLTCEQLKFKLVMARETLLDVKYRYPRD